MSLIGMKEKLTPFAFGTALGFLVSGAIFFAYWRFAPSSAASVGAIREDMTNYRYIDPLLVCNAPEATTGKYKELDARLRDVIADEVARGDVASISLYFQEYPGGRWVGIDENHRYDPASLLKIVLMIAYFKDEELHPGSLEKRHIYSASMDSINQSILYASSSQLQVGKPYSALELIRSMIIDSDNGAKDVLLADANDETVARVYRDLKVPDPAALPIGGYTISPREYSMFFRILYNATYLGRTLSEKAMEILAEAHYANGLVGGLPKGVSVAHKYGEHVNGDGNTITSVELHDCGVVYGPNLPYFLCVMTTGKEVAGLERAIQNISRTVYESVDLNSQKNP